MKGDSDWESNGVSKKESNGNAELRVERGSRTGVELIFEKVSRAGKVDWGIEWGAERGVELGVELVCRTGVERGVDWRV